MLSPQPVSVSRDSGTLFTGFLPVESLHSGEAFNPCPLPVPSVYSSPLYMDMFYFHSSCLLAALSPAQRGTNSILIGTYLVNVRNIFEQQLFPLPVLLPPNLPLLKLPKFYLLLISLAGLSLISRCPTDMDSWQKAVWLTFLMWQTSSQIEFLLLSIH